MSLRTISRHFPTSSYVYLDEACRRCSGTGSHGQWMRESKCEDCHGTGVNDDYRCADCDQVKPLHQVCQWKDEESDATWKCDDCWDRQSERNEQYAFEAHHGGSGPMSFEEQMAEARRVK